MFVWLRCWSSRCEGTKPRILHLVKLPVNLASNFGSIVFEVSQLLAFHSNRNERVSVLEVTKLVLLTFSEGEAGRLTTNNPRTCLHHASLQHGHIYVLLVDDGSQVVSTKCAFGRIYECRCTRKVFADVDTSSLTTEGRLANERFVVCSALNHLIGVEEGRHKVRAVGEFLV